MCRAHTCTGFGSAAVFARARAGVRGAGVQMREEHSKAGFILAQTRRGPARIAGGAGGRVSANVRGCPRALAVRPQRAARAPHATGPQRPCSRGHAEPRRCRALAARAEGAGPGGSGHRRRCHSRARPETRGHALRTRDRASAGLRCLRLRWDVAPGAWRGRLSLSRRFPWPPRGAVLIPAGGAPPWTSDICLLLGGRASAQL